MGGFNDKSIAVLGDSIANGYYDETGRGWVVRFIELLNSDNPVGYFVCNHAVSADTIYDVKYRLFGATERAPDILIISVGVNDTQIYGTKNNQMAISEEIRKKLWYGVLRQAQKITKNIFVFGLLPVNEEKIPARENEWAEPQFYRNDFISAYNNAIKKWCQDLKIPFIDNYQKFIDAGYKELLSDDVHPNTKGHELLARWAYEELKGKI